MSWQKLKNLIHSIKPTDFEKLAARLLELHLEIPFVIARSGDQPRGDARSLSGVVSMQAKLYKSKNTPLSPIARWWHYQIENETELYVEPQDVDPKLLALVERFWYRCGNSLKTNPNIEVFNRKLREYCRGEKLSVIHKPRIAPWWKPNSGGTVYR